MKYFQNDLKEVIDGSEDDDEEEERAKEQTQRNN